MTTQPIFAEIYDEGVANAFKSIGNPLGSIQIIFVAQGQWEDRVGPFLSWPLAMMNPETNKPVFNGLSVIAPPGSRSDEITAKLAGAITAHRARWSGRGLPDGQAFWMRSWNQLLQDSLAELRNNNSQEASV